MLTVAWMKRLGNTCFLSWAYHLVLAALAITIGPSVGKGTAFPLDGNACILISPTEPSWVQQSARDLQKDIKQLLGAEIPIVNEMDACRSSVIMLATRGEKWLDSSGLSLQNNDWDSDESFVIKTIPDPWNVDSIDHVLLISGYDSRGTMYGIYTLSEEYLGIDPLYYWTGYAPTPRSSISLTIDRREPSPTFRLRGFFINDEDLLCGWKGNKHDIELDIYEAIFETMVRLKFNMGITCTWQLPTDPELKRFASRGLILTQHHVQNMGADPACGWDKFWKGETVSYSYRKNADRFHRYWAAAVKSWQEYPGEIIWQTGFRGKGDKPFWTDDPDEPGTPQGRGQLIQDAVNHQIKMLKEMVHPEPQFITTTLWMDIIELYSKGYIQYPSKLRVIWCDNGQGAMRSMRSETEALPPNATGGHDGIYYHVDFQNDWYNQLCQTVSPDQIQQEFCRPGGILDKECTAYVMLNVGDIRHVVMGMKAISEIGWNAKPWQRSTDYSEQFYNRWCEKYFGEKEQDPAKQCYKRLFEIPWRYGPYPDQRVGIQGLMHCARLLLKEPTLPKYWTMYSGTQTIQGHCAIFKEKCGHVRAAWKEAWDFARQHCELIPKEKRQFFKDDVMLQIGLSRACNEYLYELAQSVEQKILGNQQAAADHALAAMNQLKQVFVLEKEAEWGKWENWFSNDIIAGIPATFELTQQYHTKLAKSCETR